MAISHELSTEIATALLAARERSPGELNDLKEVVLQIHSTFERLTQERHEKYAKNEDEPPPLTKALGSSV